MYRLREMRFCSFLARWTQRPCLSNVRTNRADSFSEKRERKSFASRKFVLLLPRVTIAFSFNLLSSKGNVFYHLITASSPRYRLTVLIEAVVRLLPRFLSTRSARFRRYLLISSLRFARELTKVSTAFPEKAFPDPKRGARLFAYREIVSRPYSRAPCSKLP